MAHVHGSLGAGPPRARAPRPARRRGVSRGTLYLLLAAVAIALVLWFLAQNVAHKLLARGIPSGFDFLAQPAGFDIGEHLIAFDAARSYGRAFVVGLLNTVRVAAVAIVLTTVLGMLLGLGRFSGSLLVRGLCQAYVEFFRNTPVLLQLMTWYLLMAQGLPAASEAWQAGPFFLSKAGLSLPLPLWPAGAPLAFDLPHKGAFAIEGGAALTPEFMAVLLGLTTYTAAFVAEIVRAGIGSVPRGQVDAAAALGMSAGQQMRFVQLPQALRVIVPPLTNQFLNVIKNSSLAVAIGYPDLVSVANTTLNQTGRAVECIALVMAIYLALSLLTSALMRRTDARTAMPWR